MNEHERLAKVSMRAAGLWAKALCCGAILISPHMVNGFGGNVQLARELTDAGLWTSDVGGYRIVGEGTQLSDKQKRERTRLRVQKHRARNALQSVTPSVTKALHPALSPLLFLRQDLSQISDLPLKNSPSLSTGESESSDASAREGFRWLTETLGGMTHDYRTHIVGYRALGSKPADERAVVAATIKSDPWLQTRYAICTPDFVLKQWQRHLRPPAPVSAIPAPADPNALNPANQARVEALRRSLAPDFAAGGFRAGEAEDRIRKLEGMLSTEQRYAPRRQA